ncbi:MAG: hypothetical protein IPL14_07790 [Nitrospira sp.]|nr:hypothetical protein [Nitrospira sp.]
MVRQQTDYLKFTGQNNPPVDYPLGPHYNVNVWNLYNNFLFWMTLRVLDFRNVWPYFTGGPVEVVLTREIYGTACGTSDYELIPDTPWETIPTQPVNRIEVFAGDRIDGVRLTYPSGGGPNGQTQIVCGDPFHSTGVTLFADQDPLVEVTVYAGDIVSALSFEAKNGDQSGQIANNKPPGSEVTVLWAPPGEIISSVYINGTDQFYQSANLIIFGFQYQRKATADLTALRHLYVVSPSQIDLTELAALRDQACLDRCADGRGGNGRVGSAAPAVLEQPDASVDHRQTATEGVMTTVTSPEALSVHKLLQLPATFAWSVDPGHLSTIGCCADIDGDGRDEFIVSSAQATSPVACLSVLSYVQPNELDPGWSGNQQPTLVVQWSSSAGIPNWMYPPSSAPQSCSNFSFWSADVDGDGIQEIIAFFPGYTGASASLGVLKWDGHSLSCVWQTFGVISGIPGTHSCPLASGLQLYPMQSPAGEGETGSCSFSPCQASARSSA